MQSQPLPSALSINYFILPACTVQQQLKAVGITAGSEYLRKYDPHIYT